MKEILLFGGMLTLWLLTVPTLAEFIKRFIFMHLDASRERRQKKKLAAFGYLLTEAEALYARGEMEKAEMKIGEFSKRSGIEVRIDKRTVFLRGPVDHEPD